ncbi:Sphingomyelin synthase-like domain [Dillenia turbinata]|uniref:Sphingomyelin synthase-like domain n=1 Tax=Dillenia turbinata TaxID=194707 RepID=A0AAN8VNF7_9MAGN
MTILATGWGSMSFLIDFQRPTTSEGSSWFNLLKKAGGDCKDLLYSGHLLVPVLTAMAWTAAYGGLSSALIWMLVFHSAQREIRERHHYKATASLPSKWAFSYGK